MNREAELMVFFDDAPVIVLLTDAGGSCIFLNRRWYEITGQRPEMALGMGWTNAIHPDDREIAVERLRSAIGKRESHRFESRLQSKGGAYRWAIYSAAPRFDHNGEFLGFMGMATDVHDRKESEEKLLVSEERYRFLFESIDEGFCVIEMICDNEDRVVDFRYLETNRSFEQQTGLARARGSLASQIVPDLDQCWIQTYEKVALTGVPIRIEDFEQFTNRWFSVFAFRVDRPELRRVAVLFSDITERKTRDLNQALLAELGVDFARASSPRELIATVGTKVCRHLHVDSTSFAEVDEAAGVGRVEHIMEDPNLPSLAGVHRLADFFDETILNDLRAGRTVAVSDVSTDPRTAGMVQAYEKLSVRSHIQGTYLSGGRWKFMLAVHSSRPRQWRESEVELIQELSARVWLSLERAKAEENLRKSEQRVRAFFEGSGVGAALIGSDISFQKVNDCFCEITGYSQEELMRMTPLDLDHPDEIEADRERIREAIEVPGSIYDVEKRYVRKDGRIIWVHVNSKAVRDPSGNPLYGASFIQDITDRKQAEDALRESERNLRELSHSLEQRVAERTAELHAQTMRLRHLAADLASAEQRERKRLAALLHDDLQQLLVAANMHLYNASRHMKDETARQAVEQAARWIGEATGAARSLTQQLRPPALYEDSLVAALFGLAREMAERHHLDVAIEGDDADAPLSDDIKALLFESVREFLFNVVKHAGVDKALVHVWDEAQWLHVVVEDAGKGFDVGKAAKSRSQSGFGLFSIHERLAALGGKLSIASAPGEGTHVALKVPLLPKVPEGLPPLPVKQHPLKELRKKLPPEKNAPRRIRVMVVDDHAMVRQGLATLLNEDERLEVIGEAADGLAAIDAVEHKQPDVMLLDLNMPRMNGIEATREIHRRWPKTIIIGLSVQDDDATANAIRAAGAAAFLPKAGDADRMISTIVELANGHRSKRP